MEFHPGKCSVLPVDKKKSPASRTYALHGYTLQEVSSTKYLGVTLQCDARCNHHIDGIVTKANRTLAFLRKNLKICSPNTKYLAYNSLARPLLEYASTVWNPATEKDISRIEVTQRRAARFVSHRYQNTSCVDEMLQTLSWPTLEQRRKSPRLSVMYKVTNKLAKVHSPELQLQPQSRARCGHEQCYRQVLLQDKTQKDQFLPKNCAGLQQPS